MMESDLNIKMEINIKNEPLDSFCDNDSDFNNDSTMQREEPTCGTQMDASDTFEPCGVFVKIEEEVTEVKKEVCDEVNIEEISNENSEHDDYENKFMDSNEDFEQLEEFSSSVLCDPSVSISILENFIYNGLKDIEFGRNEETTDEMVCSRKETKRFLCLICKYGTNRKADYRKHLFTHSRVKLLQCPQCDYRSNIASHLARHLVVHTERKKLYKCTVCGLDCSRRDSLKMHLLTHSKGAKLFKCPQCDFESNRNDSLKFHLLSHLNCKLFKCAECDFESNRKSNFKRHLLTHSIMKLYKCPDCDYECNQKSNFKRHLLRHSKSVDVPSQSPVVSRLTVGGDGESYRLEPP